MSLQTTDTTENGNFMPHLRMYLYLVKPEATAEEINEATLVLNNVLQHVMGITKIGQYIIKSEHTNQSPYENIIMIYPQNSDAAMDIKTIFYSYEDSLRYLRFCIPDTVIPKKISEPIGSTTKIGNITFTLGLSGQLASVDIDGYFLNEKGKTDLGQRWYTKIKLTEEGLYIETKHKSKERDPSALGFINIQEILSRRIGNNYISLGELIQYLLQPTETSQ